jgi:nucleoside-diphosphate-sugar epimerase
MKSILIAGGAGYIGTVLTQYLLEKDYNVTVIDNFLYKNNYSIHSFLGNKKFKFLNIDINDSDNISKILDNISNVVILAGVVGDPITKKYPEISNKINEGGVKNFIDCCNGKGLDKVIFVSTCSNYGLIKDDELADENFVLNPLSLYAKSKVLIEKYILDLRNKVDYHPTILRFATAFGLSPRMRFDLTISEFVKELALGKELTVYDADTWRPYCHVKDFARLIFRVIEESPMKVSFEVFNAGGDDNNFTKKKIVDLILKKLPRANVKYQNFGGDPRNYRVNFAKVKKVMNFEPKYSVEYGIDELIETINNRVFDDNNDLNGNYKIYYNI